jgi:hypothetical protein
MSSFAFETCFLKKGPGVKTLAKILLYQLNFVNAERLYNVRKHAVSSNLKASQKTKSMGASSRIGSLLFLHCFNWAGSNIFLFPFQPYCTHSDVLTYCILKALHIFSGLFCWSFKQQGQNCGFTQDLYYQGVTKICRLSWLTNSALVYEPKCGGMGRGGVAGSQPMRYTVQYCCAHRDRINFGDLTPYLTYDTMCTLHCTVPALPPEKVGLRR